MRTPLIRSAVAVTFGLLLGLPLAGCGEGGRSAGVTGPGPHPSPLASTPAGAVRLLEWSYNNRSLDRYGELFTDDFRWVCAPFDSSVTVPWSREAELISAAHLFVGGDSDAAPASSIRLAFDRNLLVLPDPHTVAWDPTGRWHRTIRTFVDLHIVTVEGDGVEITGLSSFHLVRADSASIPADLLARGFGPDSLRWYIRGWEDETGPPPDSPGARRAWSGRPTGGTAPLGTQPLRSMSWCRLKSIYR
jgi:hypothetical protein